MAITVKIYVCYKVLVLVKFVNEAVPNMVCLITKKPTPLQLSTLTKMFSEAMLKHKLLFYSYYFVWLAGYIWMDFAWMITELWFDLR